MPDFLRLDEVSMECKVLTKKVDEAARRT